MHELRIQFKQICTLHYDMFPVCFILLGLLLYKHAWYSGVIRGVLLLAVQPQEDSQHQLSHLLPELVSTNLYTPYLDN